MAWLWTGAAEASSRAAALSPLALPTQVVVLRCRAGKGRRLMERLGGFPATIAAFAGLHHPHHRTHHRRQIAANDRAAVW